LHVSTGGEQVDQRQPDTQARRPTVPQDAVHDSLAPRQQLSPAALSQVPSQSSSTPLHVSAGGAHAPQVQAVEQTRVPGVPQPVVHVPLEPRTQAKVSSVV
jgi:hypothetical protein